MTGSASLSRRVLPATCHGATPGLDIPALQPLTKALKWHRPGDQIALGEVDALGDQHLSLGRGLDSFCDHLKPKAAGKPSDRPHQQMLPAARLKIANEAAIDLEPIERQIGEIGEARIARAEIIEGKADTDLVQLA